jgi:hypothetical protein
MFHAFVNYQSAFIKNEMAKLIRTGDIVGLIQYAGTIGILFPSVAPLMKSAELLLRTGSPTQAEQSLEEDYRELIQPNDEKERFYKWAELVSYLGAYGVWSHYLQAAQGHRLANQVLGPVFGTGVTAASDLYTGIAGRRHDFKPLSRDIIRYGIPVAGGALEHQLLPTRPRPRRR